MVKPKIGAALKAPDAIRALKSYKRYNAAQLEVALQPGNTVHAFTTEITGGHLIMRGPCYIGQEISWIR